MAFCLFTGCRHDLLIAGVPTPQQLRFWAKSLSEALEIKKHCPLPPQGFCPDLNLFQRAIWTNHLPAMIYPQEAGWRFSKLCIDGSSSCSPCRQKLSVELSKEGLGYRVRTQVENYRYRSTYQSTGTICIGPTFYTPIAEEPGTLGYDQWRTLRDVFSRGTLKN